MKTKLTLIAGLAATAALISFPSTSEARPCGTQYRPSSGFSISFSSGGSHFRSGSSHFSRPSYISRSRYYCPPTTYRRTVSYYRPVTTRYVSAPANRISVADVQYVLRSRGYNVGRVDGRLGSQTSYAIKQFQRDVGLRPCGTLTQATLRAMGF